MYVCMYLCSEGAVHSENALHMLCKWYHEGLGIVDVGIFKHVSMYVERIFEVYMYVCMYVCRQHE